VLLLLIYRETTVALFGETYIDDLERLWNPKSGFLVTFFAILSYGAYFNSELRQNYGNLTRTNCAWHLSIRRIF